MSKKINKVAVIGAGVMGSGIAALLAGTGIHVVLLDIDDTFSKAGYDRIKDPRTGMLYEKSQIDYITAGNITDDLEKLRECDWVLEAASENLSIKREIMKKIYPYCKADAVISTNTSGVSINAIAEGMDADFKRRFMGTHFFNPPRYMALFEMIPTNETKPELVKFMADFAENELGKSVVPAKDTPNFVANRIGVYAMLNSMQIMEKYGFNIPTVDLLCGPVMGRAKSASFRTVDIVGLDILNNVAENVLQNTTNPAEQKLYAVPWFVKDRIENGALGDKTKVGFYKKAVCDGKKVTLAFNLETKEYEALESEKFTSVKEALKSENKYAAMVYGENPENKFTWENLKNILLYAASLIPEIADDYHDIDSALKAGFNWEAGPFEIWDKIDVEKSIDKMRAEGDVIPEWVEDRLKKGQTKFYENCAVKDIYYGLQTEKQRIVCENEGATLHDIGDEVLCLEFHTKGNSLGIPTMDMMLRASEELTTGKWKGLVVGNTGKTFCAGADLNMIGSLAKDKEWDKIEEIVNMLQSANMALKYAARPVVSAPFGSAVGGGAEVAMHTIALPYAETYMGLVESRVGLVPAGGGCTELLVKACNRSSEKGKIALFPIVKKVWKQIANSVVSSSAADAIAKGYLSENTHVILKKDALIQQAKKLVLEQEEWRYHPAPLAQIPVLGDFARAAIFNDIEAMRDGNFISEYDAVIGKKVARILTGGDVPCGTLVKEQHILDLEKEAFLSLCGEERTQVRIEAMLTTGKPLHN